MKGWLILQKLSFLLASQTTSLINYACVSLNDIDFKNAASDEMQFFTDRAHPPNKLTLAHGN